MISNSQRIKSLILITGDFLVFQVALFITITIRFGGFQFEQWRNVLWPFCIIFLMWIVVFFVVGLYDLEVDKNPMRLFRNLVEGMLANLGLALAFFYLIPIFGIGPRTILLLQFAVSLLLGYFWRIAFTKWIATKFIPGNILYIGNAEDTREMADILKASTLGHELKYAMPISGELFQDGRIEWISGIEQLRTLLKKGKVSAIVLGIKLDEHEAIKQVLYETLFSPIAMLDRAEIEEAATGRIPLSYVSETWFLRHLRESDMAWYEIGKRISDILMSIPVGILTLLTLPFISITMKLTMPGPIFYSQTRVGKGGKKIRIWKFRTMRVDAEKDGAQFTADAKTDPRLTKLGRILRRLRLDELPQVWNILKGELSFIGPRPERPEFVAPLTEQMPYYALRHITRPGLTGWAQVKFLTPTATLEDNLKKLQYDLFYIKHRSPLLDLVILLRTIGIILRRQGT